MPPLLQLRDTGLTLGGAPLLDGAELSISAGDRIAVVGRNGSGKSTLFRIAAGQITADRGSRFVQPSARLAYLPQEPDMSGFATTLDYVLAGLNEFDDAYAARAMMTELGVDPAADPARLSGGEARRAALVRTLSPGAGDPAARRADQSSRSGRDRMAGGAPRRKPFGACADQPRQAAACRPDPRHDLARPWPHPPPRSGLRRVRGLARREARGGGARAPQARPQDRQRRTLDALRRHGAPQAQHAACRGASRSQTRATRSPTVRRRSRHDRARHESVGRAGDRCRADQQILWRSSDRARLFAPGHAPRQNWCCRGQRGRQDDAYQSPNRRPCAGLRRGAARRECHDGHSRSAARVP